MTSTTTEGDRQPVLGSTGTVASAPFVARSGSPVFTALTVFLFAIGIWAAWNFTIDDAFITWRYSQHFAEGHGPVWNSTGDPVEGFTNFAWMLYHVPFAALGLSLPVVAKVTSALLGVVTLAMLIRVGRRYSGSTSAAAFVAPAVLVSFLPTYFHITSGLETMAFAAVVLRGAILGLKTVDNDPVRTWEPPTLLVLAGMIRPEGVLALLPPVIAWVWMERRSRSAWLWIGVATTVGAAYFFWRWSFYGQLLPNTFYIKFGSWKSGVNWAGTTGATFLPLVLLTVYTLRQRNWRARGLMISSVVAGTYVAYVLSGPSMNYLYRFAYHALPVLFLGAACGLLVISRTVRPYVAALILVWVVAVGVTANDLPTVANYGPDLQRAHVAIGRGLARADIPDDARTLAVSDAGAIPYYSDWTATDYIGLNNEAIAGGRSPTNVVLEASPTVVIATGGGPDHVPEFEHGMDTAKVLRGYSHVMAVQMREGYWEHVYSIPRWADEVEASLRGVVLRAQQENDPGRYEKTLDRWLDRLWSRLR